MGKLALSVLVVVLVACGNKAGGGGAGGGGRSAARSGPLELPKGIPEGTALVGVVDAPADWFASVASVGGLDAKATEAMRDDLALYVKKTTGLELARLHRASFFWKPGVGTALIASVAGGEWKGPARGDLAARVVGDALIIGDAPAVEAAAAVAEGKAAGLAADAPLAKLFAGETKGAVLAIAADLAAIDDDGFQQAARQFGAEHAIAHLSGAGLGVVVLGDGKKLEALAALVEVQIKKLAEQASRVAEEALGAANPEDGFDPEAFVAVANGHMMRQAMITLEPKVSGGRLSLDFPIGTGGDDAAGKTMVVVVIVGVLAAVAIPAFMKYIRKSKSSEAVVGVKRLYDGVRAYHVEHQKLPASVGPTPPPGTCCKQPGERCAPDPKLWDTPGWSALRFSMDDPYQYSYEYIAGRTDFTVRVLGDLDCDGDFSTFEMVGQVGPDGSLTGSAGIYKEKELE